VPVAFQSQQSLRKVLGVLVADEVAAVVAQHVRHIDFGVPAERAPDRFVHVVVATFRVSQKPDGIGLREPENRRLAERTRIDRLAALSRGKSRVPVRDRVFAAPAVRDVRVMTDRKFLRDRCAQLRKDDANLRTISEAK